MSEEEIKKTLDEAKILEKLDHPNIIRFISNFKINLYDLIFIYFIKQKLL